MKRSIIIMVSTFAISAAFASTASAVMHAGPGAALGPVRQSSRPPSRGNAARYVVLTRAQRCIRSLSESPLVLAA